jgi:hypothetical protein
VGGAERSSAASRHRTATALRWPGVLHLIFIVFAIALAVAPFVVIVQTLGWVIGQHSFPDGTAWAAAGFAVVFWVIALAVMGSPAESARAAQARPRHKRYVMRGYGGGKNATSLHPRQAKQGKRIVYIPGSDTDM